MNHTKNYRKIFRLTNVCRSLWMLSMFTFCFNQMYLLCSANYFSFCFFFYCRNFPFAIAATAAAIAAADLANKHLCDESIKWLDEFQAICRHLKLASTIKWCEYLMVSTMQFYISCAWCSPVIWFCVAFGQIFSTHEHLHKTHRALTLFFVHNMHIPFSKTMVPSPEIQVNLVHVPLSFRNR